MPEPLDPLRLPLQGSQLIEASAGTGKTWTIAALYLRLVLGHDCTLRVPAEILVMTFTRAATRELSDRIRRRLVQAAACFRSAVPPEEDLFLGALISAFSDESQRQQAAWRLAAAAEAMDEAAVHTIDAWCQRMLRDHAFDSGCLFDEELQAEESAMLAEAVRDYWRQQVYPLQGEALAGVLAQWRDIQALTQDIRELVDKDLPAGAGAGSLADAAARVVQQRAQTLVELKDGWAQRADQMLDWLTPVWDDKKHPARKALPGQAHATRWIQALKTWALDASTDLPDVKTGAKRLTHSELSEKLEELGQPVQLPECFAAFEALMAALQALPQTGPALRLHAAACVAARVQQAKANAGTFGFADMINRLDAALDESVHGARAQRLRQRIIEQYPVALIDEFQDTSPVQLRIFDRLYRIQDNEPSRALLLIGDPKQAIYSFRGADIYSYLGARAATQGRHHVLGTNHRSTQALVQAVNTVFESAEARVGEGAFMFREEGAGLPLPALLSSPLPFIPVQAHGRAEQLQFSAGVASAVTLVFDPQLRNKQDSRQLFAALCAERIVTLLNDPQAGFAQQGQPFRRLRPADLAVLVRSMTEAQAVRLEMRRRGLASVYLSDKDSVFDTAEAADLMRLLQALAAPRNVRLARAALATRLLGLSLSELIKLVSDDAQFDQQCELLLQLSQVWKSQGVLAMLRRALHAFGLPARWLGANYSSGSSVSTGSAGSTGSTVNTVQGERRLTNVLHLAELLQAASAQAEGEQALIRWLGQQIADAQQGLGGGDDLVLRLESDADLVKVVTVHKSKGLEYPLVFLPFAAHFRELINPGESEKDAVLLLPGAHGMAAQKQLVLQPSKEQLAVAEKERQREALRLLYVAMTRARHALWVGLSGLQAGTGQKYLWHRSAIGYLLSGPQRQPQNQPQNQPPEQRLQDCLALTEHCNDVALVQLPAAEVLPLPALTRLAQRAEPPPLVMSAPYAAQFERHWTISSYSALVREASWGLAASGALPTHLLRDDEPVEAAASHATAALRAASGQAWHQFPRGALAGNFLHDQLQWLAEESFALDTSEPLQRALQRRCERQGWGHRAEEVVAWLSKVCTTPLPALGAPLAAMSSLAPEMEFWLPSDGLQAHKLDALCQQYIQPAAARPLLPERKLKGMLMGFADLVFEHQGRFWVLDYKSNALGTRDTDYTQEAMNSAMLQHRYDVQAALYMLALHRLLQLRLGAGYVPAQRLGGAVYYYLRGVNSAGAGCCHLAPPLALLEALDAMLPHGNAVAGRAQA